MFNGQYTNVSRHKHEGVSVRIHDVLMGRKHCRGGKNISVPKTNPEFFQSPLD